LGVGKFYSYLIILVSFGVYNPGFVTIILFDLTELLMMQFIILIKSN